jgi:hypothetical protein
MIFGSFSVFLGHGSDEQSELKRYTEAIRLLVKGVIMTKAEKLIELVNQLPDQALAEAISFVEALAKQQAAKDAPSFEAFFGALKDEPLFDGRDGVEVQKDLRNDWR